MKKLLFVITTLFAALIINAQSRLDTVFIRNLQLKGEEYWWGISGINPKNLDSNGKKYYKKLTRALENANPSSATNVTVDSVYGEFGMKFLMDYWKMPEARENMGQGIDTKIRAYTPLAPYIDRMDSIRLDKFNIRKTDGRTTTKSPN